MASSHSKSNLIITRYENVSTFISETKEFLRRQEIKNTFVFTMAYQQQQQEQGKKNYYCGAVWNSQKQLVFAIFALNNDFLYASSLLNDAETYAINLLLDDVLSTNLQVCGLHGYQPVLNYIRDFLESETKDMRFEQKNAVWSYKLTSSELTACVKPLSAELRIATKDDLEVTLLSWTKAFVIDCFGDKGSEPSIQSICQNMISSQSLYLLCVQGRPVSMGWKVRPLHDGCSLAYVYTPEEFRHQGYGAACVSMTCEEILKTNGYITLFVDHDRNPEDNLYTRVGFKLFGEAGRLSRLK